MEIFKIIYIYNILYDIMQKLKKYVVGKNNQFAILSSWRPLWSYKVCVYTQILYTLMICLNKINGKR